MTETGQQTGAAAGQEQPRNQWLEGPFAPADQEVTVYDLKVTGTVPKDLDGRLLRVGPNPVDPENPVTYNWFTGNGMVHGVRIRDGKAEWYRNRFVRDDQVAKSRGSSPLPGPRQLGGGARYVDANVVNTHIFPHVGKTWAFAEAGVLPIELSYELESMAKCDFGGTLNGSWTGHPHRDPVTGELHGMTYYHGWEHVSYQVIGAGGKVSHAIDVPVHGRPVVHDMALTQRYAIFLDGPVAYSDELLSQGYTFPFMWGFEYPTRWVLVPRGSTNPADVISCEVERWAVFHILGAYDLPDGRVALIGPSNARMFVTDRTGPGEAPGILNLYLINPATGKTEVRTLDDRPQEMPRLDDRLVGSKYRYGYFSSRDNGVSTLIKQDLDNAVSESYAYGPGRFGMEAVFVPRTAESAEDDGWLMTYVTDMRTRTSEIVILHSQDLAAGPVAVIHIPHRVPIGFHGNWVPDSELEQQRKAAGL
ncbi:MAG TPA: carotenoid oxygenase family protein [Trebonia sp.]|jgi:carotenoid cleavage dioxygenase